MLGVKAARVPRAHKFGAQQTLSLDNIKFASKSEAARYQELLFLQRGGAIRQLRLQTKWPLIVNGITIGSYVSDFDYLEGEISELKVEDVKGVRTPLYRLKRKHFEAQYGIKIIEV
jgi:hypothetical protein